jgi:hypothetical protein
MKQLFSTLLFIICITMQNKAQGPGSSTPVPGYTYDDAQMRAYIWPFGTGSWTITDSTKRHCFHRVTFTGIEGTAYSRSVMVTNLSFYITAGMLSTTTRVRICFTESQCGDPDYCVDVKSPFLVSLPVKFKYIKLEKIKQ